MCCTKHVVVLVLVAFPKEQCQNRAHVASARFLYNGASEKINSYREKKKSGRTPCVFSEYFDPDRYNKANIYAESWRYESNVIAKNSN